LGAGNGGIGGTGKRWPEGVRPFCPGRCGDVAH